MNTFVKRAYDAGVQQAMVDFGLTKQANPVMKGLRSVGEAGASLLSGGAKRMRPGAISIPKGQVTQIPRYRSMRTGAANRLQELSELVARSPELAGGLGLGAGALGTAGLGYGAYEGLRDPTMMERLEGFAGDLGLG